MGIETLSWAWKRRSLSPLSRLMLLHLAECADMDAWVDTDLDALLLDTGMKLHEATNALVELEDACLILPSVSFEDRRITAFLRSGEAPDPSSPVRFTASGRLPRDAWERMRAFVFERDGFACTYCGASDKPLECDHVIPVSRGGSNEPENLTTACFDCNRSKRDMTPEEWLSCQ